MLTSRGVKKAGFSQQKTQNERLANKFNPEGRFPFTVLVDAAGKVVHTWDGYPTEGDQQFLATLKKINDAYQQQTSGETKD